ncbi:nucleotidyltransferase family protein [Streptacidiphilus sp. P02-A3a]|uniref:nucleotidyltransferase domain-containing protein n=1 Tax=Streptacidiphilus sp. P02-A3a TaxID=2704468 RepID=UPI0015FA8AEF|nr:nucleotidyltransferase family protein [Streptacidiphilus sp. P02-A3a]QMU71817.1 nucleotidyltransferase family protein [Streptacidiphilus sp. P02-A3a]
MPSNSSPRAQFDDEIRLALLLSAPRLQGDEVAQLRDLSKSSLDWNRVLGILALHRTMGLAWENLVDHGLAQASEFLPAPSLATINTVFRGQILHMRDQVVRNSALIKRFDAEGIPCAIMKGTAVASMAYPRVGTRMFSDNDFLFPSERLAEVGSILKELGYIQGQWDPATRSVKPVSRQEILLHPVTSHETYPYKQPTPDAPVLDTHCVDVHFSVDLMTGNRNNEAVFELLARRVDVEATDGNRLWALSREDMFVFLCVHFQREGVNRREVECLKDLLLYKVADILAMMGDPDNQLDFAVVAERARGLGFEPEVFYTLTYVEALYPQRMPDGLVDIFRPTATEFLHQVTQNGEVIHTWTAPIAERFFDPRRSAELRCG